MNPRDWVIPFCRSSEILKCSSSSQAFWWLMNGLTIFLVNLFCNISTSSPYSCFRISCLGVTASVSSGFTSLVSSTGAVVAYCSTGATGVGSGLVDSTIFKLGLDLITNIETL